MASKGIIGVIAVIAIIVIGILSQLVYLADRPEDRIRLLGLILQIFGIGAVMTGIIQITAQFRELKNKIKIVLFHPLDITKTDTVLTPDESYISVSTSKVRPYEEIPGTTPEAFVGNVKLIHERITQTQKEMDEEFKKIDGKINGKIEEALENEKKSRRADYDAIKDMLASSEKDRLYIFSAISLLVGIILSTAAKEIVVIFF